MKKVLVLLWGLFFFSSLTLAQQDKEIKNVNSSLTITMVPTIFFIGGDELDAEAFFPTSLCVTKNFIIKKKLSVSTGVHLLYKKLTVEGRAIADARYYGPIKYINRFGIVDIPLRLNFNVIKPNDKFNLYATTEIKNSLIALSSKGEPDDNGEYTSKNRFGYNMFLGIGFGFDFKVINRLYFYLNQD